MEIGIATDQDLAKIDAEIDGARDKHNLFLHDTRTRASADALNVKRDVHLEKSLSLVSDVAFVSIGRYNCKSYIYDKNLLLGRSGR